MLDEEPPEWIMHVQLVDGRLGRVKTLTENKREMVIKFDEAADFITVPVSEVKFVYSEREWFKRYNKARALKKGIILP